MNRSPREKKPAPWKERLVSLVHRDVNASRREYFFAAPEWLCQSVMNDPKDKPLFYCIWNVLLFAMLQVLLVPKLLSAPWWVIALLSGGRIAFFATRFILGLHFASHNPLVSPTWLNTFILEFVLCPLMGIPCGTYSAHHVVMHHKEDNVHPWDLSSTMPYRRDRPLHFLFYWLRFELGIWLELPYFLWKRAYYRRCVQSLASEALWLWLLLASWRLRPALCLWMFFVPQVVVSFMLMFGNFSQHMFVHPSRFDDDHNLTVNLVDTPYNQLTFNDGYHIVHHKYMKLHWSQLPSRFATLRELDMHSRRDAICFHTIDYFQMGVLVMFGRLQSLASYLLPVNEKQAAMSVQEKVAFLKQHLQPIGSPPDQGIEPLFGLFKYFVDPSL